MLSTLISILILALLTLGLMLVLLYRERFPWCFSVVTYADPSTLRMFSINGDDTDDGDCSEIPPIKRRLWRYRVTLYWVITVLLSVIAVALLITSIVYSEQQKYTMVSTIGPQPSTFMEPFNEAKVPAEVSPMHEIKHSDETVDRVVVEAAANAVNESMMPAAPSQWDWRKRIKKRPSLLDAADGVEIQN